MLADTRVLCNFAPPDRGLHYNGERKGTSRRQLIYAITRLLARVGLPKLVW